MLSHSRRTLYILFNLSTHEVFWHSLVTYPLHTPPEAQFTLDICRVSRGTGAARGRNSASRSEPLGSRPNVPDEDFPHFPTYMHSPQFGLAYAYARLVYIKAPMEPLRILYALDDRLSTD